LIRKRELVAIWFNCARLVVGVPVLQIGEWQVDPALDEIRRGDELVKLEPRMTRLLVCLAERPGDVVSSDELLERVWPGVVVNPGSVYQVIALLRKSLGDEGDQPRYIATVPRKGYRLVAPVSRIATASAVVDAEPDEVNPRTDPQPRPTPVHGRRWALAAIAVFAMVAATVYLLRVPAAGDNGNAGPALSLVVMPLTDLSTDGSNAPFCSGLTDELVNSLGRIDGLKVMGRTSATRVRDDRIDTREIGRVLGVTHVLEGSVRVTAGRLRVSAQLVSTVDGFQVWSNSFDRPRTDAIDIQTEIARAVVDSLALQLSGPERDRLGRAPTKAVNAYELYLLGRYNQLQRKPDTAERAIEYQKQAIAADPKFALAHAGLADAYMQSVRYLTRSPEEAIALAQPEVDEALRLDPELAEGYVAWGTILLDVHDNLAARKAFEKALAINPNYGTAMHGLGISFEWNLQTRESLEIYARASALDPLNPQIHISICNGSYSLGRFAAAEKACLRANELQPEVPNSLVTYSETALFQGDLVNAIDRLVQALARDPSRFDLRTRLGLLYLDAGLTDRALAEFAKARKDGADPVHRTKHLYGLAANGDEAALARELAGFDWHTAPIRARTEAAYVATIARKPELARSLLDSVRAELAPAKEDLHPSYYQLRLGTCELCSLIVLERADGRGEDATAREKLMLEILGKLDAGGYTSFTQHYFRAVLNAARGEDAAALAALERAAELGLRRAWLLRLDPALARLRMQPRFIALLQKIDSVNTHSRAEIEARAAKLAALVP
jgi:DNA-binding winged helix-turn-helix (wHTH) protein/TolB-like protein